MSGVAAPRRVARPGVVGVDRGGVRVVQHIHRVGPVTDPEGDAKADVRPDVGRDDAAGTLGRQHEVDPQRTPDRREPDQAVHEVGQLLGEDAELVDGDDQSGYGGKIGASGSCPPVLVHVARPGVGEEAFAAPQLGRQ